VSIINRRHFISTLAAASSTGILAPSWAVAPKRKLGVALVGLGHYSRELLAPGLLLTQHCELRGIVTGSPEKIPVWQKKYGLKDTNIYHYGNMAEVANNPEIDVLYIVVPTFLHAQYSIIAANAGKHVWCEKPMAMSVTECQQIIDACQKNKVKLSIGYRLQHEPNTCTVMEYARTRPYGAIRSVIAKAGYAGNGAEAGYWRMDISKGGGALYDMGVYPINGARLATGLEPIAVTARHEIKRPEMFKKCDETTIFTLEFAQGVKAECATSVGEEYSHLKVTAERGWYELEPMQSYTGVKGRTSDGKLLDKTIVHQQAAQMDDDALAIINNVDVMVPGREGLMDIRVVEGALLSAKTKKRVELA
jgi:glucose-fructose oxidoreductase